MRTLCLLLLFGCRIPPADPVVRPTPQLASPTLTSVVWSCEPDRERWQLDLGASSWTGAATLWLSRDLLYVEQHTVPSIAIEPDGSADTLRLRLDMQADWRAVQPDVSTAFTCSGRPNGVVALWDLDGVLADCAVLGDGILHPDVPVCDEPFDEVEEL